MTFRPDRPYNDLPSLPPREDVETKAVLKACIAARASLAQLRVSGQLIPNQSVLINSIPVLEAAGKLGNRKHRHHDGSAVPLRQRTRG